MPKISEMRESKFLKKEDVGAGSLMTVESCEQHNVAMQGAEPELKWCLSFAESDKPLVLNSTNIQLCANIFGSEDTDDWVGKKLVLYTDPNVSYAGKLIGGIRVRAPKVKTPVKAAALVAAPRRASAPPPEPEPEYSEPLTDDDIPF